MTFLLSPAENEFVVVVVPEEVDEEEKKFKSEKFAAKFLEAFHSRKILLKVSQSVRLFHLAHFVPHLLTLFQTVSFVIKSYSYGLAS